MPKPKGSVKKTGNQSVSGKKRGRPPKNKTGSPDLKTNAGNVVKYPQLSNVQSEPPKKRGRPSKKNKMGAPQELESQSQLSNQHVQPPIDEPIAQCGHQQLKLQPSMELVRPPLAQQECSEQQHVAADQKTDVPDKRDQSVSVKKVVKRKGPHAAGKAIGKNRSASLNPYSKATGLDLSMAQFIAEEKAKRNRPTDPVLNSLVKDAHGKLMTSPDSAHITAREMIKSVFFSYNKEKRGQRAASDLSARRTGQNIQQQARNSSHPYMRPPVKVNKKQDDLMKGKQQQRAISDAALPIVPVCVDGVLTHDNLAQSAEIVRQTETNVNSVQLSTDVASSSIQVAVGVPNVQDVATVQLTDTTSTEANNHAPSTRPFSSMEQVSNTLPKEQSLPSSIPVGVLKTSPNELSNATLATATILDNAAANSLSNQHVKNVVQGTNNTPKVVDGCDASSDRSPTLNQESIVPNQDNNGSSVNHSNQLPEQTLVTTPMELDNTAQSFVQPPLSVQRPTISRYDHILPSQAAHENTTSSRPRSDGRRESLSSSAEPTATQDNGSLVPNRENDLTLANHTDEQANTTSQANQSAPASNDDVVVVENTDLHGWRFGNLQLKQEPMDEIVENTLTEPIPVEIPVEEGSQVSTNLPFRWPNIKVEAITIDEEEQPHPNEYKRREPASEVLITPTGCTSNWKIWTDDQCLEWALKFVKDKSHRRYLKKVPLNCEGIYNIVTKGVWKEAGMDWFLFPKIEHHFNRVLNDYHGLT